jgi:protein-L-isoaspartate(D-aspartate) O-methyltransferase
MDIEQARFNMVEQQIRPWNVLDPDVLDLLFHVKREEFVEPQQHALAFADISLPLSDGSSSLQPKQEARMLQDLAVKPGDVVLQVGTGSGYVTALLAKLSKQVFTVDSNAQILQLASERLHKAKIDNVTLINDNALNGLEKHGPFDAIFVSGSLALVPEILKQQLSAGGRMIVTIGDDPLMSVYLIQRQEKDIFSQHKLYETSVARLPGSEAIEPNRFTF